MIQRRHLVAPMIAGLLGAVAFLYWHLAFAMADTTVLDTNEADIAYIHNWVLRALLAMVSFAAPFGIVYAIVLLLRRRSPDKQLRETRSS